MTVQSNRDLHILSLQNEEILMRSITSTADRRDIVDKKKIPIHSFSTKPEESVDLFTYITPGEAMRLGWSRAVQRGKEGDQSRSLHGWLVLKVEDGKKEGGSVKHTPEQTNRHHVSICAPPNSTDFAKHRHNLAERSAWCEHPGPSFRAHVVAMIASRSIS